MLFRGGAKWVSPVTNSCCLDTASIVTRRLLNTKAPPRPPTASSVLYRSSSGSSDTDNGDSHVQYILENNKKWIQGRTAVDPNYFQKLSQPQTPKYLYFGCSDSRVHVEDMTGLGPGEVFVHRNIGNLVPMCNLNAISALEYAVRFLNVSDILVVGHYDCGAVRASTTQDNLGVIEPWLQSLRDVQRLHQKDLSSIQDPEQRHRELVKLNVIEQCLNVFKTRVVQRKRHETRQQVASAADMYPRVHGMVFDPADGTLTKLPVNFRALQRSLNPVYGLY